MRPFGLGIDIVEIARFEAAMEKHGTAFLERIFLPPEIAYCTRLKKPVACYAARFAVKEAVSKAFGTGIGGQLGLHDMEIRRKATGEPFVVLHGAGAETARRLGIREILISISHTENYAAANAIALCDG